MAPDSSLEPDHPPGFEQLEPAVRQQFAELLDDLARARRDALPAPAIGRAWGALGQWFHVYRFPDSAAHCYREAARLDPAEPRWSYYLGLLAVDSGNLVPALAAFETAARLAPESTAAPMQVAEVMLKLGRAEQAEDAYRRVLDLKPDHLAAAIGLARFYLQRREADRALQLLESHPPADGPGAAELNYLMAQAYRLRGDAERARRHLALLPEGHGDATPIAAQDPWRDELMEGNISSNQLTRLGMLAYRQGNYRSAAIHSGKAVVANPDNAELRTNYAAALLALGRAGAALEQLDAALELDPELARAYLVRGSSHLYLGDTRRARAALEQAVELDGGLKDARRQLGRLYQRVGATDAAIEQYAQLRARYREVHQARFWHAALLASIDRSAQALAALDEDLGVHPSSSLLRLLQIRLLAAATDETARNPTRAAVLLAELAATYQPDIYFTESAAMVAAALGYHARAVALQSRAVTALETLPAREAARIARRRLTLYRDRKSCRTPWEPGESLITKSVEPPPEFREWMADLP